LALAVTGLTGFVAQATPYASSVTRSGNAVSFVLNQNAAGLVVLRDGANPVYPGTNAGPLSFDMTGYASYQIIVTGNTAAGWSQYIPDGADRNFYYPPGVSINKNPASTNFGKIYIVNSRAGTTGAGRNTPDGIYLLRPDGVADGGARTGGVDWTIDGANNSSPWKCALGPDDHLYVASYYNDLAYEFNDDLSAATQLIDASNKTTGQYVESIWVEGTQAAGNRKLYLCDSHYQDSRVGLIMYDLGANAKAAPGDTGTQAIGPTYFSFYPRDVVRDSHGYWYMSNYRASAGEAPAISKFDGSLPFPINSAVWDTGNTYTYTLGLALNEAGGTVAVGSVSGVGPVYIFDMATGAFVESFRAGNNIRRLAFDAAGNLVTVDNSLEYARFWSPGGYTVATTRSDGTFSLFKPSVNVSVVATTPTASMDLNQPPGVFTITRSVTGSPLTVGYTLTGTATNGAQYQLLTGKVTFQPADATANIVVTPIPFTPAGPTRSVILTLNNSNTYAPAAPFMDTIWIADTNKPTVQIAVRDSQFYERTNDFARFRLTRWGDTNVPLSQVNVSYGGTAVEGTHFYGFANTNMNPGDVTQDVFVMPIHDGVLTGPLTVTATVGAAPDNSYNVGTPASSGAVTRVDADDPPETLLWADYFTNDTHLNWSVLFATTNGAPTDFEVNDAVNDTASNWPYDYTAIGVPPAPHAINGDTHGLRLTANKDEGTAVAAALNCYPIGKSFSGNYALRFDMYLIENSSVSTTEYALFGINHSGTRTNWFRNSVTGFNGVDPTTWSYDGIFYDVEADGSGLGDYVGYSSPTTTNRGPTALTPGVNASSLANVFKSPPWTPGAGGGGAAANVFGSSSPIWADVEVRQVNNVITWSINHTLIFAYTNATSYKSGNIMLGYEDAYDSIGSSGGSVVYANVRVISLASPVITKIVRNGANAEVTFTANSGDVVAQFTLQSSSAVTGPYADTASTISSLGGGAFKAVKAAGASQQFYRVRRLY
jgi:hypothetical protein